jgi:hypothetical protein
MKRVFNDKNIKLMRSMALQGHSASDIARRIGSTDGSVRVLASRMGIRFQSRVFNDSAIAVMRAMSRDGKSAAQVAKAIGSTNGSVRTLASRLGIRFRSRQKNRKPNDFGPNDHCRISVDAGATLDLDPTRRPQTGFELGPKLSGKDLRKQRLT